VSKLLNIHRLNTSSYHPQTYGFEERFNSVIASGLSNYVDLKNDDWDRFLPGVAFAYRSAVSDTTGFSPFFMLFGREPRLPIDVDLIGNEVQVCRMGLHQQETFRTIVENLSSARKISADINSKYRDKMRKSSTMKACTRFHQISWSETVYTCMYHTCQNLAIAGN
jgi:hypothetical protein